MLRFLPNLHESWDGIKNFPSICLQIVATNCEVHKYRPVEKKKKRRKKKKEKNEF